MHCETMAEKEANQERFLNYSASVSRSRWWEASAELWKRAAAARQPRAAGVGGDPRLAAPWGDSTPSRPAPGTARTGPRQRCGLRSESRKGSLKPIYRNEFIYVRLVV